MTKLYKIQRYFKDEHIFNSNISPELYLSRQLAALCESLASLQDIVIIHNISLAIIFEQVKALKTDQAKCCLATELSL